MATVTMVEMGETGVQRALDARLQACGLGACVGLCLYETLAKIAVLVHVVLPQTFPAASGRAPLTALPGKCADTALMNALAEIKRSGGQVKTVRAALVGGAQIFTPPNSGSADTSSLSRLEIGQRNVLALKEELGKIGIPICAEETGGHGGRTVTLEARTGNVWVRPIGLPERLLVSLGQSTVHPAASAMRPRSGGDRLVREGTTIYGN
ncbi:MAG: chemotaxis protein CheD [Janthinobacterium lividum]